MRKCVQGFSSGFLRWVSSAKTPLGGEYTMHQQATVQLRAKQSQTGPSHSNLGHLATEDQISDSSPDVP